MYQQAAPPYQPAAPAKTNNVLAIVSLIVGIVGLLSSCCVLASNYISICSGLLGVVAIILGAIGVNQINKSGETQTGKGLAIAGIILGALSILLPICLVIINIIFLGPAMGNVFSNILESL